MQQSHRMQVLNPLALMKVRAFARHILHVSWIHQTRLNAVFFQHVVDGNPVDSCRFHRHGGDAAALQPFRHFAQVAGESIVPADAMIVPVRRHGDKDLPRSDVDACRARMEHGILRILSCFGMFLACCRRDILLAANHLLLFLGHRAFTPCSENGQVAQG